MKDRPMVSWLMPVYNAEKSLRKSLDSILNQTYQDFEIIIVNDSSTDATQNILEEYMEAYDRIKVICNKKNMGVAVSLNNGLELCLGKYIARMDADDYSHPDRLKKQVDFMEQNEDVVICGSNVCRVNEKKGLRINSNWPTDSEEIRCRLLFNIQSVHPTVIIRGDYFRENNVTYPDTPAEDYNLFASLISKVKMANLLDVLLDYYVDDDEQVTTLAFQKIRQDNLDISKRTIRESLGVDTDGYPDILFGARNRESIPYYENEVLEKAYNLFSEMMISNNKKEIFDRIILEEMLLKEWRNICGKMHLNSFKGVTYEYLLKHLNALEHGEIGEHDATLLTYPKGRAVIYGTGSYASEYVQYMDGKAPYEVIAYCDTNPEKWGTLFLGKKVISPSDLDKIDYDYIFIAAPVYFGEIKNDLVEKYGVTETRIVDFRYIIDIKALNDKEKRIREYGVASDKPRIFIFCAPDYANLGDHAIAYAERKFIKEYIDDSLDVIEVPTRRFAEADEIASHFIKDRDLILITGGGFLGSLWMNPEVMVRTIVSKYPNNRIIIMPQTLYWGENARQQLEARYTREIYGRHSNLLIYARDRISFDLMKKYYPECQIKLAPDMVLSVDWTEFIDLQVARSGALLCLKDDKESILSDDDKERLADICKKKCGSVVERGNMHPHTILDIDEREDALHEQLSFFQKASVCITDRLHGMLFAVITGTPCIVMNSCNHKLKEGYEWVKELGYIRFASDIGDVAALIDGLQGLSGEFDRNYFSKQYEDILKEIKSTIL